MISIIFCYYGGHCDRLDDLMKKHWSYCGQSLHRRNINRIKLSSSTTTTKSSKEIIDENDDIIEKLLNSSKGIEYFEPRFDFILKSQRSCTFDNDKLSSRIVGGEMAERFEFPWQVSLRRFSKTLKKWYHSCGGVIIDNEWILTAAHCVLGSNNTNDYRIRIGEYDYSIDEGYEFDYNVSDIIAHKDFNFFTVEPDICLIKLKERINFNITSNIRPICFPQNKLHEKHYLQTKQPSTCISTGWGKKVFREFEQDGEFPKILQKVCVNIVDHDDCRKRYSEVINVTNSMICLGEGGMGTCEGDSGGPFQCLNQININDNDGNYQNHNNQKRWSLYGLTSWAVGCAEDQYPSVATNVATLREWIYEKIISLSDKEKIY